MLFDGYDTEALIEEKKKRNDTRAQHSDAGRLPCV